MKAITAALTAVASVAGSQAIGAQAGPSADNPGVRRWYRKLAKPAFAPPGSSYGIIWTGLDVLLAHAGYRLLRAEASPARGRALAAWTACVTGIASYPVAMFRYRSVDGGLIVAIGLVGAAMGAIGAAWNIDRKAALSMIPLLLWLGFALVLQADVKRLNR